MRLVVWNLCSGTDRKWPQLLGLRPTIAVLPETAQVPAALRPGQLLPSDIEWHWVGTRPSRGLAVATFDGLASVPIPVRAEGRWSVAARAGHLTVLGVWSCPPRGGGEAYGQEVLRGLTSHEADLAGGRSAVVAGDFNVAGTNRRFGEITRWLETRGLRSAYHEFFGEPFAAETRPTYYHLRHRARPWHIDFCFLSPDLLARVQHIEVGHYDDWVAPGHSDHVPLIIDLADSPPR